MAKRLEFKSQQKQDFSPAHIIEASFGAHPAYPMGKRGVK
jgi:hypothetical protein